MKTTKPTVTVYSTTTCPWCVRAKDFLTENKIPFKDINVGVDAKGAKEMIIKSGQRGVPVIEIDDNIIIGFNEEAIRELLKI